MKCRYITIEREYGSGGTSIAHLLSEQTGVPCYGREILEKVAKRYQEIDAWNETPFMTEDAFNRLQDVMEEAGELTQRADYSKLVDNSYATRAAESLKK